MTDRELTTVNLSYGDAVTWLHQPRGGYGYVIPVPAVVAQIGRKRVLISALRRDGSYAVRWVYPANLRKRDTWPAPGAVAS